MDPLELCQRLHAEAICENQLAIDALAYIEELQADLDGNTNTARALQFKLNDAEARLGRIERRHQRLRNAVAQGSADMLSALVDENYTPGEIY